MRGPLSIAAALLCISLVHNGYAQLPTNRVKPATMFHAGDTVRSPRLGIEAVVPAGWQGVLPRDTEVFLLMPTDNTIAEIYVLLNEGIDKAVLKAGWERGLTMADGLHLGVNGPITPRGEGVITANAMLKGDKANGQAAIYLEGKCSPQGFCLTYILTADQRFLEDGKRALQAAVDKTTFGMPSTESLYDNFDWGAFLAGKVLLAIGYDYSSKRSNEVHLCRDGTFRSRITRSGIFKDQGKAYQGSKRGQWVAQSHGNKATIRFTFEKLAPVDVVIEAREEQIYINGARFFIGDSDACP